MSSSKSPPTDNSRDVVLSFHDACLRRTDIDLLLGPFWLNDEIIAFAYEYFLRRQFADLVDKICFLSPSVAQLIKFYDKETLSVILEPLNLQEKVLIFFPVNDNESSESAGGSHWSLLVYRKNDSKFYHYDSIFKSGNSNIAGSIARSVSPIIDCGTVDSKTVISVACARQQNGYDCGIFCILFTEKLAEYFREKGDEDLPILKEILSIEVAGYRKKLKTLIDDLCMKTGGNGI